MIKVNNISKSYKVLKREKGKYLKNILFPNYNIIKAVKDISFEINQGESVGYIGINGAGKSTTLKMLSGILTPDKGTISINELSPSKDRIKVCRDIGVVFGNKTNLWWDIPAKAAFEILKNMYGIEQNKFNTTISMYKEILGIEKFYNTPLRQLSLGQRTTIEICGALLHNPKLLLLDEPTIGLDIIARDNILKFIKYINNKLNTTVILTSHNMLDIEQICKRVIVIDNGTIIFDGQISELKEFYSEKEVIVKVSNDTLDEHERLIKIGFVKKEQYEDLSHSFYKKNVNEESKELINIMDIIKEMVCVKAFEIKEIGFDQIIRKVYLQGKR